MCLLCSASFCRQSGPLRLKHYQNARLRASSLPGHLLRGELQAAPVMNRVYSPAHHNACMHARHFAGGQTYFLHLAEDVAHDDLCQIFLLARESPLPTQQPQRIAPPQACTSENLHSSTRIHAPPGNPCQSMQCGATCSLLSCYRRRPQILSSPLTPRQPAAPLCEHKRPRVDGAGKVVGSIGQHGANGPSTNFLVQTCPGETGRGT